MRWRLKDNRGFSLVEMMIVIAVISIMAGVAIPNLIMYVDNSNLRSAVRDFQGDLNDLRARAISENRTYRMSINTGANTYSIEQPAGTVLSTKNITLYGSQIQFQSTNTPNIDFQIRGTITNGNTVIKNKRNSTATITYNVTGRSYVTYNMQ